MPTVAALAGRRIDAPAASPAQFPLARVPQVKKQLARLFNEQGVELLVCSAACGADLAALDVASAAGIRCRVVLPFDAKRFRGTSVTDRPGDWGPLYDRLIAKIDAAADLITLAEGGDPDGAYQKANETIVAEARGAAAGGRAIAVIVWAGPREPGKADATRDFLELAQRAGMQERFIATS